MSSSLQSLVADDRGAASYSGLYSDSSASTSDAGNGVIAAAAKAAAIRAADEQVLLDMDYKQELHRGR